MYETFLGEIKIVAFDFPPRGWALCNGQLLFIAQNSALHSLLGVAYGGDDRTTFALPDMRGRAPVHRIGEASLYMKVGRRYGEATHTLTVSEIPSHHHLMSASDEDGGQEDPTGHFFSKEDLSGEFRNAYNDTYTISANNSIVADAGGSQPHNNMMPYLALNYCIALEGIFPEKGDDNV